ncbi:MAG: nucleotidyltransferase family protein [Fervidicoccaceae archaeon]
MGESSIAAIILAGGLSTRFPGNKLLYEVNRRPIILHTVEKFIASGLEKIIVVLGRDHERVFSAIVNGVHQDDLSRVYFAFNSSYASGGMSSSIKVGMRIVNQGESVLIHPGDVPFIRPASIKKTIQSHLLSSMPITVACFNGRHAHPIIFKPELQNEIKGISEAGRGLKSVVEKYRDRILCVETGDPGTLRDIDTPEDLENALKELF